MYTTRSRRCIQPDLGDVCNQISEMYATRYRRCIQPEFLRQVYNQNSLDMYATRIPCTCIQPELLGHVYNQNSLDMYTTRTPWTCMQPELLGHVYNQNSLDMYATRTNRTCIQPDLLGHVCTGTARARIQPIETPWTHFLLFKFPQRVLFVTRQVNYTLSNSQEHS